MRMVILTGIVFLLLSCVDNAEQASGVAYQMLQGETMGTYYRVSYADPNEKNYQQNIEGLLLEINQELSTYIDSSVISRFNQAEKRWSVSAPQHILANLKAAREVFEKSKGAFDPTVMPLVNYWGFGYTGKNPVTNVDSLRVDSLKAFVGFDKSTKKVSSGSFI